MYDKIFSNELKAFTDRYATAGVSVSLDKIAFDSLKKLCYSEQDGVRFVQRQICKHLESADGVIDF